MIVQVSPLRFEMFPLGALTVTEHAAVVEWTCAVPGQLPSVALETESTDKVVVN